MNIIWHPLEVPWEDVLLCLMEWKMKIVKMMNILWDIAFVHRTNVISNINQNLVICKDIHGLMLISFIQFFKHHIKTVLKNVSKMKIVSDGRGIPQIGWNQVKYWNIFTKVKSVSRKKTVVWLAGLSGLLTIRGLFFDGKLLELMSWPGSQKKLTLEKKFIYILEY